MSIFLQTSKVHGLVPPMYILPVGSHLSKCITHVQMSQVRAATVIQTTVGLVPNLQQQLVVHFVHVADLTFRIWIHGVAIKEVPSRYGVNMV